MVLSPISRSAAIAHWEELFDAADDDDPDEGEAWKQDDQGDTSLDAWLFAFHHYGIGAPGGLGQPGPEEPSGYDLLEQRGEERAATRLYRMQRQLQTHRPRLCRVCYHEFRGRSRDDVRCAKCRTRGRAYDRQVRNAWWRYCEQRGLEPRGDGWERAAA